MRSLFTIRQINLLATFVTVAGCAHAQIMEKEDGSATSIMYWSNEDRAMRVAHDDAVEFCEKKGKQFILVKESASYRGMDKDAKAAIQTAGAAVSVLSGDTGAFWAGQSVTSRNDDYKVTLEFKCK